MESESGVKIAKSIIGGFFAMVIAYMILSIYRKWTEVGFVSRGGGRPVPRCKPGSTEINGLCYAECAPGYVKTGNNMCVEVCPAGYMDADGKCVKPVPYAVPVYPIPQMPYTSGGEYLELISKKFNEVYNKCKANHGEKNCAVGRDNVYPICKAGFYNANKCDMSPAEAATCNLETGEGNCCMCRPKCSLTSSFLYEKEPSCEERKYTIPGIAPKGCDANEEQQGNLCYKKCNAVPEIQDIMRRDPSAQWQGKGDICWRVST
jgi:hypothetical protein